MSASGRRRERMGTWWPARRRLAALAVAIAALTAAAPAASGGGGLAASVYVAATVLALFYPVAITAQVIAGQALAATMLLGSDGSTALLLAPALASVVVTAELLAVVARLDTLLERDPGRDLYRVALAGLVGAGACAAVTLVGALPGPTGFVAVCLASAACAALATVLVRAGS